MPPGWGWTLSSVGHRVPKDGDVAVFVGRAQVTMMVTGY